MDEVEVRSRPDTDTLSKQQQQVAVQFENSCLQTCRSSLPSSCDPLTSRSCPELFPDVACGLVTCSSGLRPGHICIVGQVRTDGVKRNRTAGTFHWNVFTITVTSARQRRLLSSDRVVSRMEVLGQSDAADHSPHGFPWQSTVSIFTNYLIGKAASCV